VAGGAHLPPGQPLAGRADGQVRLACRPGPAASMPGSARAVKPGSMRWPGRAVYGTGIGAGDQVEAAAQSVTDGLPGLPEQVNAAGG
jgi:hypothetical protein